MGQAEERSVDDRGSREGWWYRLIDLPFRELQVLKFGSLGDSNDNTKARGGNVGRYKGFTAEARPLHCSCKNYDISQSCRG